jgi:hypothetical protein
VEGHIHVTVPGGECSQSLLVPLFCTWSHLTILDWEPPSEKPPPLPLPLPPDAGELANYDDFMRRELPRAFRSTLEAAVNAQSQPIEELLRAQLMEMIRECQDRVYSQYRAMTPSVPSYLLHLPVTARDEPGDNNGFLALQVPEGPRAHYHTPCLQLSSGSDLGFLDIEEMPLSNQILPSDSGYASLSPLLLSEDTDQAESTTSTTTWSDEADWTEKIQDSIYPRYNGRRGDFFDIRRSPESLTVEQAGIVDRVTNGLWLNFNIYWLHTAGGHGNSSNPGSPVTPSSKKQTSKSSKASKSKSNCSRGKRKRNGASGGDDEEESREKRTMLAPKDKEDLDEEFEFACPYRKWCPAKYTIQDWGPCVMTPRPSIARIK